MLCLVNKTSPHRRGFVIFVAMDFSNINYLAEGNSRQQSAFRTLTEHRVMEKLGGYDALLVGTVPIDIDIETSDLDIICHAPDLTYFRVDVITKFGKHYQFSIREAEVNKEPVVVANFWIDSWEIEIYAQNTPILQQNGYRHMLAEYYLLQQHGEPLRQQVIELKRQGYKTEPAFAKALGLPGDPYQALLNIAY
jgi:hypothetical protein